MPDGHESWITGVPTFFAGSRDRPCNLNQGGAKTLSAGILRCGRHRQAAIQSSIVW